jgi:lambda family phage portal protein
MREHARDLVRNNGWAKRGVGAIVNAVVGWGISPRPQGDAAQRSGEVWQAWADSTECANTERATLSMLQRQAVRALVIDGEVLLRRRARRAIDGYALPLQVQVLEADYLDESKDGEVGTEGGPIVQGVEHDRLGRRVAYWLFDAHPGSDQTTGAPSRRVPAEDVIHLYEPERPEAVRGVSWLGTAIVALKDLDELEDAELMRQKIAACFAAFVTDTDGSGSPLGTASDSSPEVDALEPGMIINLPPGKEVTFGTPPVAPPDDLAKRTLRRIAVSLGITYEDLTGDYSQVNFSSARMARVAFQENVKAWQYQLVVPLLCDPTWRWAMLAASTAGLVPDNVPRPEWTAPPLPMLEPDREGLAYQRLVRVGAMTLSEMVRERGGDPVRHWDEYAADLAALDARGIRLDSDARSTSQAGQVQADAGTGGTQ